MKFLTVFRKFPIPFWRFPKILHNLSESHTKVAEYFLKVTIIFVKIMAFDL